MPTSQRRQPRTLAGKISGWQYRVDTTTHVPIGSLIGEGLALLVEHHDTCTTCRIGVIGQRLGIACREVEAITITLCGLEKKLPRRAPARQLALFEIHTDPAPVESLPF